MQCAVCNMKHEAYSVQCAVFSVQCAVLSVQCAVCEALRVHTYCWVYPAGGLRGSNLFSLKSARTQLN